MIVLEVYHYPLCPFSRKLRIVLAEKKLAFNATVEKYWHRNNQFLALNPRGDTPVITIEPNTVVYGNNAIFEFLEERFPERNLLGTELAFRTHTRKIAEWFDSKLYNEVTRYVLNEKIIKATEGKSAPNSDFIRAAKRNLTVHMDYLKYLLTHNSYIAGDVVTIADFAAAAQLSTLDFVGDVPWGQYESVRYWYALIKSRPSFRPILQDTLAGIQPPSHYHNPDF